MIKGWGSVPAHGIMQIRNKDFGQMKHPDFDKTLYLVWLSSSIYYSFSLPFFSLKCLIFNFVLIFLKNRHITARIKQNTNFNTISQNWIQKTRILCIYISFLFFRPLHPRLPASAIPLLLSLLKPLIPFALELVPMPIRYLTQYIQWDSGAGFISAYNHTAHHDSMCRCIIATGTCI